MKRLFLALPVLLLLGCSVANKTEGTKIDRNSVLNLKPGATTRQMVIESFGPPSAINYENNEEKLTYTFREKSVPVYMGGLVENETRGKESLTTLELVIKDNVVYSYRFKSAEN